MFVSFIYTFQSFGVYVVLFSNPSDSNRANFDWWNIYEFDFDQVFLLKKLQINILLKKILKFYKSCGILHFHVNSSFCKWKFFGKNLIIL